MDRLHCRAFAIGQAAAAYGFSYLFAKTGGAIISAGAFALALLLDLAVAAFARTPKLSS